MSLRHGSLNLSILLHAAAFISHLQWTAATWLSVKYNITHPLLTYLTLTILNCRSFNEARPRNGRAVASLRKWSVTKARRRRTRTCSAGLTHAGCCPKGNSRWTDRIPIFGSAQKTAGRSWTAAATGAAARTPAWRCACRCWRPRRPRPPRRAPPAPPPGAVAHSSNNYKSRTISTDTSSPFSFGAIFTTASFLYKLWFSALFHWNFRFNSSI